MLVWLCVCVCGSWGKPQNNFSLTMRRKVAAWVRSGNKYPRSSAEMKFATTEYLSIYLFIYPYIYLSIFHRFIKNLHISLYLSQLSWLIVWLTPITDKLPPLWFQDRLIRRPLPSLWLTHEVSRLQDQCLQGLVHEVNLLQYPCLQGPCSRGKPTPRPFSSRALFTRLTYSSTHVFKGLVHEVSLLKDPYL